MTLRPVDFAIARVALHRSACNRGYKLSKKGTYLMSLWGRRVLCVVFARSLSHDVALAFPFIVSMGRARVTFMVKR
jgi:hypothetical protein